MPELMAEDMAFVLVVWALEEVVVDCLGGQPSAVRAGGGFGASDTEEMLIKGGVASSELCQEGRLVAI